MRTPFTRILLAAVAGIVLVASAAAADGRRDDDDDQDEAREALERGEVLPLADILDQVQAELPGRVLEVELEQEKGAWIYELKVLTGDGRRVEVYVDAATAAILSQDED